MQELRRATQSRKMHVAQHSSEIPVDIFNLFQPGPAEHEWHKRVLHEILSGISLLVGQAHRPREQTFISLGEQLFTLLIWLCGHSALIQHHVSGLSGSVPSGLSGNLSGKRSNLHDLQIRTFASSSKEAAFTYMCIFAGLISNGKVS